MFFQDPPTLGNQYDEDAVLQAILQHYIPQEMREPIVSDLRQFGQRVVTDIFQMSEDAQQNLPKLVQYDPWGRRIDVIKTSEGWKRLHAVSAQEGLVSIGYENNACGRLHQFSKLYLFTSSSAVYSCPLAMTDGAARLIKNLAQQGKADPDLQKAFEHLTSRNPADFWTSGQWMTERPGGSDVSNSETIAKPLKPEAGLYTLHGFKWFTSATDANMTMALAKIEGTTGLSLFFVRIRDDKGNLNNLKICRLKDKLGTKAVPTAEISVEGAVGKLVGQAGRGVPIIANMINVTRLYNSISACSFMRRICAIANNYATKRRAFGKLISEQPLHRATLEQINGETTACLQLTMFGVHLMGKVEREQVSDKPSEDNLLLRLLTPLTKLYTAKACMQVVSEGMECIGGQGYIEDTHIPSILRDSQVLPIWEGTTNILSLDFLRAIQKHPNSFTLLLKFIKNIVEESKKTLLPSLQEETAKQVESCISAILTAVKGLQSHFIMCASKDRKWVEWYARGFVFSVAHTLIAALMLRHAAHHCSLPANQQIQNTDPVRDLIVYVSHRNSVLCQPLNLPSPRL